MAAKKEFLISDVAYLCHELNRAYCHLLGDDSQKSWYESPAWQLDSAVDGVHFHLTHPSASPEDSHKNWMKQKLADGWKYGETKDPDKKTHPCLVPYDKLPEEQRIKDELFMAVVDVFRRVCD